MTIEEIKTKIADYSSTRVEIIASYLYGSRANGKGRDNSDIDIAFLLQTKISEKDYTPIKLEYYSDIVKLINLDLHPIIMNNAGEVLLEQIFRKGIPIYGCDTVDFLRFKMTTMSQISDFMPLREKMEYAIFNKYKEVKNCNG